MNMANRLIEYRSSTRSKGSGQFTIWGQRTYVLPSDGYNGGNHPKQNGSVGGYMVKKMIEQQERQMSGGSSGQY